MYLKFEFRQKQSFGLESIENDLNYIKTSIKKTCDMRTFKENG